MYADDTTGYVADEDDFKAFRQEVNLYCDASGAQLNTDKSSIIFLGPPFECEPLQIIKRGKADRVLGFMLGIDAKDDIIHGPVLSKFELSCEKWANSSLSTHGKAAMVRIFAESTVEYTAPFHTYSIANQKIIKKSYWKAIYNKEAATKQRYNHAIAHTAAGGLGAMDILCRLAAHLALWAPLAKEHCEDNWAKLFMRSSHLSTANTKGNVVEASMAWWSTAAPRVHKPEEEKWKVKWLYKALITPPPAILPRLPLPLSTNWNEGWTYLDTLPIPGKTREIRWRNWLEKLKVLRDKKGSIVCPDCSNPGSSDHIINKCARSLALANMIATLAKKAGSDIGLESWSTDWSPTTAAPPADGPARAADILMTVAKAQLWKSYTMWAFGKKPKTPLSAILSETTEEINIILKAWPKDTMPETRSALLKVIPPPNTTTT
jgi:hypothetical protein